MALILKITIKEQLIDPLFNPEKMWQLFVGSKFFGGQNKKQICFGRHFIPTVSCTRSLFAVIRFRCILVFLLPILELFAFNFLQKRCTDSKAHYAYPISKRYLRITVLLKKVIQLRKNWDCIKLLLLRPRRVNQKSAKTYYRKCKS